MLESVIRGFSNKVNACRAFTIIILFLGYIVFTSMPVEDNPDVEVPFVYVSVIYVGVSPSDGERTIIKPLEEQIRKVDGIKKITSTATKGRVSVYIEFFAGYDADKAIQDVRAKVDVAKAYIPQDVDSILVDEVSVSSFPVLNVALAGAVPYEKMIEIADNLRILVETIPEVMSVDLVGERDHVVEIEIDPYTLESFNITPSILGKIANNNVIIPAGYIENVHGKFSVNVDGLIQTPSDVYELPIKSSPYGIVKLGDIAKIKKTFVTPSSIATVNGQNALVLEIVKQTGVNLVTTVDAVKAMVDNFMSAMPENLYYFYYGDTTPTIQARLNELINNTFAAVIIVSLICLVFINARTAILLAIMVPTTFFLAIMGLWVLGATLNVIVLFGLIISVGLLVDAGVIVLEYADRKVLDGQDYAEAFRSASVQMAIPVITSTISTIFVFLPLLFWPGIVGQFMKFLPITVIIVLSASAFVALVLLPAIAISFGPSKKKASKSEIEFIRTSEKGDLNELKGLFYYYYKSMDAILKYPTRAVLGFSVLFIVSVYTYAVFNHGVEFFPSIEPDRARINIRTTGNISIYQTAELTKNVEDRIKDLSSDIKVFYNRAGIRASSNIPQDTVGVISIDYQDWDIRHTSLEIIQMIRDRVADIPGILVEVEEDRPGPSVGKDVQIDLIGFNRESIYAEADKVLEHMRGDSDLIELEDSRESNTIEWYLELEREMIDYHGLDALTVGSYIQAITDGLLVTKFNPDYSQSEVDVRLRFPEKYRNYSSLENIAIPTQGGNAVPINVVTRLVPKQEVSIYQHSDGFMAVSLKANVKQGVNIAKKVEDIRTFSQKDNDPFVTLKFRGEAEDSAEAAQFLIVAFGVALLGMFIMFMFQFDSIYLATVVLSAVFLSVIGALIGLLVIRESFGVVMSGMGIISLAGIVVNNNIVLIDTYKTLRSEGMEHREALLRTGIQRIRPILITASTSVLGLLPMITKLGVDFWYATISYNSPSSQWWNQMAVCVAGGLVYATFLTLLLTPLLIDYGHRANVKFDGLRAKLAKVFLKEKKTEVSDNY